MIRYLPAFLAFAFLAFAGPARAQQAVDCHYTLECIEGEACAETAYTVRLRNEPGSDSAMTLITDAETLKGGGIQRDGPAHAMFAGKTAMHLFSVDRNFRSRYTVHMQGPMAITYHGTCEKSD